MTEEELRQIYNVTLSAISFGFETSMVHYVVFSLFLIFNIGAYMVSNLSLLLEVSHINVGQSVGGEAQPINKGKVIRYF